MIDPQSWIERFESADAAPDKLLPLATAVERAVRPEMTLHFTYTHCRPSAAMAELLRQFAGRAPQFTLALLFTTGPAAALVSEGLARRLVTTLSAEPYPSAAPSRPVQRAHSDGQVEIQHWSVLSYIARLQAAALGLPGFPVRGLTGTSLADDNRRDLTELDATTMLARPLVPDLSFVHAAAADRAGNIVLTHPRGEGVWGALAARHGVVATVERIIDTDTVRLNRHLVAIPATHVRSVSHVPLGAHPAGVVASPIAGVESYENDIEFYVSGRAAAATRQTWRDWVNEWLIGPPDQNAYVAKLGAERIHLLKGRAQPGAWRAEILEALPRVPATEPATPAETMIASAARLVARKVRERKLRSILSGFGSGNLVAWLAHRELTATGIAVRLTIEIGVGGYEPLPGEPYLFNHRNLATATWTGDASTALGALVGGRGANAIGSLGTGQADGRGRFNSTKLAEGRLLTGSGGSADVAATADEVVLTLPADPSRLVRTLPYVTGTGTRVTAVCTDLGIFEKALGDQPLRLTRLVGPLIDGDVESHIRELRARCGFCFDAAGEPTVETAPDPALVDTLRLFDPGRAILGPLQRPDEVPA